MRYTLNKLNYKEWNDALDLYLKYKKRKPSGTLNFTTADRATLWMDIKDTLPGMTKQKGVVMRAITIGWGIYNVENDRGTLVFGN